MKRPLRALAPCLALLLLTGCLGTASPTVQAVEAVREQYRTLDTFAGHAAISANCDGRIYEYEADFSGTLTTGSMTVTAPDTLAGCSITWDEDGVVLDWEQVELDTGTLNDDGLTPVDAMAVVLDCCTDGLLLECSEEAEGTELYAELENPANAACTTQCWFDGETGFLKRADLTSGGETLVSLVFSEFTMTTKADTGSSGEGAAQS